MFRIASQQQRRRRRTNERKVNKNEGEILEHCTCLQIQYTVFVCVWERAREKKKKKKKGGDEGSTRNNNLFAQHPAAWKIGESVGHGISLGTSWAGRKTPTVSLFLLYDLHYMSPISSSRFSYYISLTFLSVVTKDAAVTKETPSHVKDCTTSFALITLSLVYSEVNCLNLIDCCQPQQ